MVLTQAADNFRETVWTLPLLVFVLAIGLILNHAPEVQLGFQTNTMEDLEKLGLNP